MAERPNILLITSDQHRSDGFCFAGKRKNRTPLIHRISGDGERYVLSEDPDEMDNRFGDPGVAALQRELVDMIDSRPGPVMEELPEHEA